MSLEKSMHPFLRLEIKGNTFVTVLKVPTKYYAITILSMVEEYARMFIQSAFMYDAFDGWLTLLIAINVPLL